MAKEDKPEINLTCPVCERTTLYTRMDGSVRCQRCGYDSRDGGKK